jgi:hypothetical protein
MSQGNFTRRALGSMLAAAPALAILPAAAAAPMTSGGSEDDHAIALWEARFALRECLASARGSRGQASMVG